jgi:hypothetical protein
VRTAILRAYLAVVGANFGHGAVAPAVADVPQFLTGRMEHLVLLRGDIHFFGPKIFAKIWVHGV